MRWIAAALLTALLAATATAQNVPTPTPRPPVLPGEHVRQLAGLARSAMLHYLATRKPAAQHPLPAGLLEPLPRSGDRRTTLAELPCSAVVTLRQDGRVVGQATGRDHGLARNIVAAALQAMRSPALPDRITSQTLMDLTIELSVLGEPVVVIPPAIASVVEPGLVGLELQRGIPDPGLDSPAAASLSGRSLVLPSAAYVLGWDAGRMQDQCRRDLGHDPMATGLTRTWRAFRTAHIIDYPGGGGTWLLYRGKVLRSVESLGAEEFRTTARRVAGWLIRETTRPDDPGGDITQRLQAAWILARYGRAEQYNEARTAARAILGKVAAENVMLNEDSGKAHVVTANPRNDTRATALFLLATTALPNDQAGRSMQKALGRYLHESQQQTGLAPHTQAMIAFALARANVPDLAPQTQPIARLLTTATPTDGEDASPADRYSTRTLAWIARASLAAGLTGEDDLQRVAAIIGLLARRQILDRGAVDAWGGYWHLREQALTANVGPVVSLLGEAARAFARPGQASGMREKLAGPITEARRYGCRMTYRPAEAYFVPAAERNQWDGAVRIRPEASQPSVEAAAAVLEALLEE